ncbi:Ctf8p and Ctf18p associating protein [Dimargaris verticillata]|uniref:Ctf8p and Ctf18p associating protein n=1 Tax=Dimargaris verticillata TaxID=2761393 RepID=A0A9W8B3Y1_9FUNG|nr:Ctf8p and Ctf18p associating protein [Dimargaris verticillata]
MAEYSVVFSDGLASKPKHRLIELPPELAAWLTTGDESTPTSTLNAPTKTLTIRGLEDDNAVLCTPNQAYEIRQVNVSNTMLVAQRCMAQPNPTIRILDSFDNCFELEPTLPRASRVWQLLSSTSYSGPEYEELNTNGQKRYTWDDLCASVQLDDRQLMKILFGMPAILLDGYFRLLDPAYVSSVLQLIFATLVIEDVPLDKVPVQVCLDDLADQGIPSMVITQLLRAFALECSPTFATTAETETYALDTTKVTRFFASQLLQADKNKRWLKRDFMDAWRKLTPEALPVDLALLRGLVVEETQDRNHQTYIYYLAHDTLSHDPPTRFRELFRLKERWTAEEMEPFIETLTPSAKKRATLVLKHCRMSKHQGATMFTSRVRFH